MTEPFIADFDPERDLVLERVIDVPPALVWEMWTKPEHLRHWFVPAPWTIAECEIDLRPGGIFRSLMRPPAGEGEDADTIGCFLDVQDGKRLVWTESLLPGFRPGTSRPDLPALTAVITFEPEGKGTRYRAHVLHANTAGRDQHTNMGFHEGWGTVLDQLVAYARSIA